MATTLTVVKDRAPSLADVSMAVVVAVTVFFPFGRLVSQQILYQLGYADRGSLDNAHVPSFVNRATKSSFSRSICGRLCSSIHARQLGVSMMRALT